MPTKVRLDEAITKYKRFRKAEGLSQSALTQDAITLQALMKTIGGNLYMENVTNDHVVDTMITIGQTCSARTRANHFYNLQNFFKFCATSGKCMSRWHDPMEGMKVPKYVVEERRRLPVQAFPVVLDAARNRRDRILFAAALYLLSRSNELVNIRVGDLNLSDGRIRVKVSKRRSRTQPGTDLMPITKEFDRELREWLKIYQDHMGYLDPTWYLFPALSTPVYSGERYGVPFVQGFRSGRAQYLRPDRFMQQTHKFAQRALRDMNWLAAGETGEGMHTFRRAGARARFDALRGIGYDGALRQVQALLHHVSSEMTEHYIGLNLDKLERDEALIGQDMYPQLTNPEVIDLAEFRVDPYDAKKWHSDLPGFKVRAAG